MPEGIRVDLYCEDGGHEQFARALIMRLAAEEGLRAVLRVRAGRGGHAKAIAEFRAWQSAKRKGAAAETPDLLVLLVDGNCSGWNTARKSLSEAVDQEVFPRFVVGCPDPHVERWCLADPVSFAQVVSGPPRPDPGKCERHLYKELLRESILAADQPILTSEMEYAPDLVAAMDLFRAGKNQPSLKSFVEELRGALRGTTL